jgi:hypothetical protein
MRHVCTVSLQKNTSRNALETPKSSENQKNSLHQPAGKDMASVIWVAKGVIHFEFMQRGKRVYVIQDVVTIKSE